jgi:hypothetical protein
VTPHITVGSDAVDLQRSEAWRAAMNLTMMNVR